VGRCECACADEDEGAAAVADGTTIDSVIERARTFRHRDVTVSALSGGHINSAFLVQAGENRYVVRFPGPSDELRVLSRADERRNTVAAAMSGASPRVLEYLDGDGVMILDFVHGETLTDDTIGDPDRIPRIAAALKRLHGGSRFRTDFDMLKIADGWLRVCDERAIATPEGLRDRMDRVRLAARALKARSVDLVPSHNDLSADNLIDDGHRVWLIDLEFSGNNDPCYDLVDAATQAGLDADWPARMCEAYFGAADPVLMARMSLHATIAGVGWAIWASILHRTSSREIDFARIVAAFWEPARTILDSDTFDRMLRIVSDGRATG
jgi:thiamine kinase-like enzyme